MKTTNSDIDEHYTHFLTCAQWHDHSPASCAGTPGGQFALSPLLAGVEVKFGSANWRLCSRLAHDENFQCDLAGVSNTLVAEYLAWTERWSDFSSFAECNAQARLHIQNLEPVQFEIRTAERLRFAIEICLVLSARCAAMEALW